MFRAAAAALLLLLAIPGADAMRHRAIGRSMARHQHAVAAKKASRADPTLLKGGWSLCPPSNAGCPSVIWSSSPGSGFSCPGESEQDKKTKREFVNDDIRDKMESLATKGWGLMTPKQKNSLLAAARGGGSIGMGPAKLGRANQLRAQRGLALSYASNRGFMPKDFHRAGDYENACKCGVGSPVSFDLYMQKRDDQVCFLARGRQEPETDEEEKCFHSLAPKKGVMEGDANTGGNWCACYDKDGLMVKTRYGDPAGCGQDLVKV